MWTLNVDDMTFHVQENETEISLENIDHTSGYNPSCPQCGCEIWEDGDEWAGHDEDCELASQDPKLGMDWVVNGARISVEENRVMVTISVGDPRGAFAMAVERIEVDGKVELRLQVPHYEDLLPHMKLEPLASKGYYRIKEG